jgi:tRNA-2-methylthio-N6-dimethylallyladenosine synthase
VNFSGLAAAGEIVPVQITSATSQTLVGELSLLAAAAGAARGRRCSPGHRSPP